LDIIRFTAVYGGLPRSIYFLFFARIVDNMGNFIIPLITLILTRKIGFSPSEAGTLATIFMVLQAPFLLLGGKLIDIWGSRKVLIIFNTLGALAYLPCAFLKPGMLTAVIIAVAANFFTAASPALNSIVIDIVKGEQLKSAYSLLYLGFNLGYMVGPVLAGLMFNNYLNLLFVLDSLTALVSTAFIIFFVKIPKRTEEAPAQNGQMVDINVPINKSAILYFIFENRVLLFFSAIFLIYNFAYSQWSFMLPIEMTDIFKIEGAKLYSYLIGTSAVLVILLTPLLTALTKKFQSLPVMAAGGIFYLAAFLIFGFNRILALFFAGAVLLTVGQILVNINSNLYIAQRTPKEYIGRANSLLSLVNGIGFATGPIIAGHALLIFNFAQTWSAIAGLMLISSGAMFLLHKFAR
jgi:MFS family permease